MCERGNEGSRKWGYSNPGSDASAPFVFLTPQRPRASMVMSNAPTTYIPIRVKVDARRYFIKTTRQRTSNELGAMHFSQLKRVRQRQLVN